MKQNLVGYIHKDDLERLLSNNAGNHLTVGMDTRQAWPVGPHESKPYDWLVPVYTQSAPSLQSPVTIGRVEFIIKHAFKFYEDSEIQERLIEQITKVIDDQPVSHVTCRLPERDDTKPAEAQGLFRKFDVRRVDGSDAPGGKHYGCEYFVLDLDHDPHAPAALRAYAEDCKNSHPQLSNELSERFGAQSGSDDEISNNQSAESYLRKKYGAYRGHHMWRDLEAAFHAGRESLVGESGVTINERLFKALERLVNIENGSGMAVVGWKAAMDEAESVIAEAKVKAKGLCESTADVTQGLVNAGWVQFIDGVQTQNFARDRAELALMKKMDLPYANERTAHYVPVFFGVGATGVNQGLLAEAKQAEAWITQQMIDNGCSEDLVAHPPEGSQLSNLRAAIADAEACASEVRDADALSKPND